MNSDDIIESHNSAAGADAAARDSQRSDRRR